MQVRKKLHQFHYVYVFCSSPTVLGYCVLFFLSIFPVCFSALHTSTEIMSNSEIFSSIMSKASDENQISKSVKKIQCFGSWNFQFPAYIGHLFLLVVSFIIRALSILIIVVSNPWPDNANIPVMLDSNDCSVPSNCIFPLAFSISCAFFSW